LVTRAQDEAELTQLMKPKGCRSAKAAATKVALVFTNCQDTDELRSMICRGATSDNLKLRARRGGMRTLFEDAWRK